MRAVLRPDLGAEGKTEEVFREHGREVQNPKGYPDLLLGGRHQGLGLHVRMDLEVGGLEQLDGVLVVGEDPLQLELDDLSR